MNVKIKEYPYRYKAFALNVFSEIEISGLGFNNEGAADVYIDLGNVPGQLSNPLNKGVLFQANENEFLLHVNDLASFFVENGAHITVELKNNIEEKEVSAFLLGTVFGALLHQRRLLPIHGSSVLYKGKCMVFSGISGAGKSTLAAAFIEKGATLIADDISLIDLSSGIPMVIPAFPGMKIWEDSLKKLGKNPGHYNPIRSEMKKYLVPVSSYQDDKVRVDYIFTLNTHNKHEYEYRKVVGIEKFNMLKNNTYFFRGMSKTGIIQQHFDLCNKLAQQAELYTVTRPNSEFALDKLIHVIESITKIE